MATVDTTTHGLAAEEREKYAKDGSLFAQPPSTFMSEIDALRDSIEALVEFIETSDVLREKLHRRRYSDFGAVAAKVGIAQCRRRR